MPDAHLFLPEDSDGLQEMAVPLALAECGMKLWTVRLDALRRSVASLLPLLSVDERQRAERFATAPLRDRYLASHAALRALLGRHAGANPASLQFNYTEKGKPSLVAPHSQHRFSLSHCEDVAIVAIASRREVGVDVELVRRRPDLTHIAEKFFSLPEVTLLRRAPSEDQLRLFYRLWTCKEAALKAIGAGITAGLHEPDVSSIVAPNSQGALDLATRGVDLRICELTAGPDCAAGVAVEWTPIAPH